MILEENEMKIEALEEELLTLDPSDKAYNEKKTYLRQLKLDTYSNLTPWDKVCIARSDKRIKARTLISHLITEFYELKGDQYYADDAAIISGLGYLGKYPVTILAQAKGSSTNEKIQRNFGMTSPEGFRKTLRLAKEAEKFHRPIISIVDTSGAYPGKGAEERGQSRAIAENLMEFSKLNTPIISLVLSEGGSGGALALTVSDYIYMFENAVYSVLSPEGFSSILFKGSIKPEEAVNYMKMTSHDLKEYGIVDEIISEPLGGLRYVSLEYASNLKEKLISKLEELTALNDEERLEKRYLKYRQIG